MKYYIAENGQPAGPFKANELLEHGLTVNSQVWNESMTGWTRVAEIPELVQLLQQSAPQPAAPQPAAPQPAEPPVQSTQTQGYGQQPSPYAQPQYQQPQYQQQQYQQPQQYSQQQMPYGQPYTLPQGFAPKNWMTESVILTVLSALCCCNFIALITGIVAIVNASKVNGLFQRGDQAGAVRSAKQAKMWALITLGVMLLGIIISVITLVSNPELMEAVTQSYENGYSAI